jgi:hypothetical protein
MFVEKFVSAFETPEYSHHHQKQAELVDYLVFFLNDKDSFWIWFN